MINWYPGHMAKSLKNIQEKKDLVDLFVVVLDSRIPLSSYNQDLEKIAPHKPRLFVFTKYDLCNKARFQKVLLNLSVSEQNAVWVNLKQVASRKIIVGKMHHLLQAKKASDRKKGFVKPRLRAFVVGIPNSGKSTLINLLASSKKAATGNLPGVTKSQAWIKTEGLELMDTPGILWPKLEQELTGIKLAAIGSIKKDVVEPNDFFNQGYVLLSRFCPEKLLALNLEPTKDLNLVHNNKVKLCRDRGFVSQNQRWDFTKANNFFINYLKNLQNVTFD